jgi:predicted dithiol-disulfide oxidoreductase (DUF899 family)
MTIAEHKIVSREKWLEARREHLKSEKALTRMRDLVAAERRQLPWVKVEKEYIFDTSTGQKTLSDLFDGRSQLIIKHFMLGPGWKEGCVGCSFEVDHVGGALIHLENHDVTYVAVARAPLAEIETFRQRMGWRFIWVSSFGSDFNYDYGVSFRKEDIDSGAAQYNYRKLDFEIDELAGQSVFYRNDAGEVFHTYSVYARGDELLIGTYNYLDMTPKGRNETGPDYDLTDWVRLHDSYDGGSGSHACCSSQEPQGNASAGSDGIA